MMRSIADRCGRIEAAAGGGLRAAAKRQAWMHSRQSLSFDSFFTLIYPKLRWRRLVSCVRSTLAS
jgi:hypothetical protein